MADKNDNKILQDISNKLEDMKKTSEDQKSLTEEQTNLDLEDKRTQFQDEQRFDLEIGLMKDQNYILENILSAVEDFSADLEEQGEDKGSFFGNLFGGLALGKLLSGSITSLFVPIFKTLFSPKGLLGIGKKLIKFVGAPIAAIFAGLDFWEGWKNAEEIVGRSGLAAQYQAGFSKLVSSLTLGIIDPQTISQKLDEFNNWFFENITTPVIDFITKIPEMLTNLPETIKNSATDIINSEFFQSLLDIPLFNDIIEKTQSVFNTLKDKIVEDFINPIKNILASIIETFDEIVGTVTNFKENAKNFVSDKIDSVKDFFGFGDDEPVIEKMTDRNDLKKQIIKDNITNKTIQNNSQKTEKTTNNNNVLTDNRRTSVYQSGVDMSTRSDDLLHQSTLFGF